MSNFKNVSKLQETSLRYANHYLDAGWELLEIVQVQEEFMMYIMCWTGAGEPVELDIDGIEKAHKKKLHDQLMGKV